MHKLPDWFHKMSILLFWLLLWQLSSLFIHNRILLVGPCETLCALGGQIVTASFWKAVCFSAGRICLGFLLAFFLGLLTGSVSYRSPFFESFLAPLILSMKSIPVACFVILALIWTGASNLSVFISFLVVCPIIHTGTLEGLKNTDPLLLEAAGVFRVPFFRRVFYIYRISLYPYLMSACKTALGMGFKSGIAAEVIGVPAGSIGEGLYQAKLYLSTPELFSWTLTILLVSAVLEKLFLLLLKILCQKGGYQKSGSD